MCVCVCISAFVCVCVMAFLSINNQRLVVGIVDILLIEYYSKTTAMSDPSMLPGFTLWHSAHPCFPQ